MGAAHVHPYPLRMVDLANSILYVGEPGPQSLGHERALVASGIGVATVAAPETAVSYVRNTNVPLVLLDDEQVSDLNLSLFAGALKVASPSIKIIAMVAGGRPRHVDTVLEKPCRLEALVRAVHHNLADWS